MESQADIGVFGGSGFYSFAEEIEKVEIETPYGKPSDKIAIATIEGKKIAFLPRHGEQHQYPPHLIPYRANIFSMKSLGVKAIIGPCSCGSLKAEIRPGDFVITDQFVDWTKGRKDTFFDGPEVKHMTSTHTYDNRLREIAIEAGESLGIRIHKQGTIVAIQGPRFSTKAESRLFSSMGWDVVNMTQYPEGYLAFELGIPYVNIALITDYDAGLEGRDDIQPVTYEEVLKVFSENSSKVKELIVQMIKRI